MKSKMTKTQITPNIKIEEMKQPIFNKGEFPPKNIVLVLRKKSIPQAEVVAEREKMENIHQLPRIKSTQKNNEKKWEKWPWRSLPLYVIVLEGFSLIWLPTSPQWDSLNSRITPIITKISPLSLIKEAFNQDFEIFQFEMVETMQQTTQEITIQTTTLHCLPQLLVEQTQWCLVNKRSKCRNKNKTKIKWICGLKMKRRWAAAVETSKAIKIKVVITVISIWIWTILQKIMEIQTIGIGTSRSLSCWLPGKYWGSIDCCTKKLDRL